MGFRQHLGIFFGGGTQHERHILTSYICHAVLLKTSQSDPIVNHLRWQKVSNRQISTSLRNLSVLCVFLLVFLIFWLVYSSVYVQDRSLDVGSMNKTPPTRSGITFEVGAQLEARDSLKNWWVMALLISLFTRLVALINDRLKFEKEKWCVCFQAVLYKRLPIKATVGPFVPLVFFWSGAFGNERQTCCVMCIHSFPVIVQRCRIQK